nr:MAG TPA: hypothetical protein [Caudoviricetes sp.]
MLVKVLIFLFMIAAFYGDRYGRNPTWTLRRETIVGIVKKRDEFIYPPSFINTVVYFVTCDIRNFRPIKKGVSL